MLCVDVGSTFTKVCLVSDDGDLLGTAAGPDHPRRSPRNGDVMDGVRVAAATLGAAPDAHTLACSSAGGGLRLAVVGYERQVTAEAGRRVGLSAGARVVHVAAGPLDDAGGRALAAAAPDLVLLVGGTDGGNADVLRHNASALAALALGVPVVVAGNVDARADVVAALRRAHQPVQGADNVVPRIGVIAPQGARAAIRAAFLEHVIGGKHLSADPLFTRVVRAPTPDAVLRGVEVVAAALGVDVLVVDVGGATTDVYSVVSPEGEDATLRREVVAPLWHARTVEGDLGMRWNADGVLDAAGLEGLPVGPDLAAYARAVAAEPGPAARDAVRGGPRPRAGPAGRARRRPAARATRRRPARRRGRSGRSAWSWARVACCGTPTRTRARAVVRAVAADHAGGWRVPRSARTGVDTAYLLFAVGLLAETPARGRRGDWPAPWLSSLRACPRRPPCPSPSTTSGPPRSCSTGSCDRRPLEYSRALSERVGSEVFLKCENLQRAGSFKIRGAYTRMARLSAEEKARGVVAASAGNHAQGVALAAQLLGLTAKVYMPHGAPMPKISATKAYGAQVELHGQTVDDCLVAAHAWAAQTGAVLIHPFDHPDIVAGQGTCGLEILDQCPDVRTVVVSAGGGGLLAGIAAAVRAQRPDVRIVGVQAEQAAAYPASLAAGHPVPLERMATMADGIAVGRPGVVPFAMVEELVDEIRTVSEASLSRALLFLLERAKMVVEPAGAAAVAALLEQPRPPGGTGRRRALRRQHRPAAHAADHPPRHGRGRALPDLRGAGARPTRARWRGCWPTSQRRTPTSSRCATTAARRASPSTSARSPSRSRRRAPSTVRRCSRPCGATATGSSSGSPVSLSGAGQPV